MIINLAKTIVLFTIVHVTFVQNVNAGEQEKNPQQVDRYTWHTAVKKPGYCHVLNCWQAGCLQHPGQPTHVITFMRARDEQKPLPVPRQNNSSDSYKGEESLPSVYATGWYKTEDIKNTNCPITITAYGTSVVAVIRPQEEERAVFIKNALHTQNMVLFCRSCDGRLALDINGSIVELSPVEKIS